MRIGAYRQFIILRHKPGRLHEIVRFPAMVTVFESPILGCGSRKPVDSSQGEDARLGRFAAVGGVPSDPAINKEKSRR
jgi:hypothetical protein